MPSMTTDDAARPSFKRDGIDMATALTESAVRLLEYIGFRPADEMMDADLRMQAGAWADLRFAATYMEERFEHQLKHRRATAAAD